MKIASHCDLLYVVEYSDFWFISVMTLIFSSKMLFGFSLKNCLYALQKRGVFQLLEKELFSSLLVIN